MERIRTLLQKADRSRIVAALLLCAVFAVMITGNTLTDKFADDFRYLYSFADGAPIRSFSGLLASMAAHYRMMNGRLVAHFFVQVFESLPKGLFNAVNAAVFVGVLALCYALCSVGKRRGNFFLLGLFAAIWIYMPAFGQVNFWLDGACNYLWAQGAALLFLLPYVRLFLQQPTLLDAGHPVRRILFALSAIPFGAYSENLSGAALFMSILLVLLVRLQQKRRVPFLTVLPIMTGMLGYLTLVVSPGERQSKTAGFSALRLLYQMEKVLDRFHVIWVIIASLVILFFIAASLRVPRERLLLAGVLTCGGVGAGLVFALAWFYPYRSLAGCMLLLTLACGVLLRELLEADRTRRAALCLLTLLTLSVCYYVPHGLKDVYLVHEAVAENRQTIAAEKAAGNMHITLPAPQPQTKYSAVEGLVYLSETDTAHYSNAYMAKFYGVQTIAATGKQP